MSLYLTLVLLANTGIFRYSGNNAPVVTYPIDPFPYILNL